MASRSLSPEAIVKRCRGGARTDLAKHDPAETFGWEKEAAKAAFIDVQADVKALHEQLYAQERDALLVVLQARDAGGKGGTIRNVFSHLDPAGVHVRPFGVPSKEELGHDYLWRVHAHVPRKGTLGVFDRSHYEDVLVVRVKSLVGDDVWGRRYRHIREFERMLTDERVHVVKFFLNVSADEQRERFQDRIDDPTERWKFRLGDLDDRALWDEYTEAFEAAIHETSTADAPWYVIPGDRKWARDLAVAAVLRHHLTQIGPEWPPAEEGAEGLTVV